MSIQLKRSKIKKEKENLECFDVACSFKVGKNFKSTEEKIEDLKQAIRDLGYDVEHEGDDIRILE